MKNKFSFEEIKQRMLGEKLYPTIDEKLAAEQQICLERLYDYNQTRPSQREERERLLKEMFANWAGRYVHLGKMVYANFNLTLVDDGEIYIGDYTMIGPNVNIVTAAHPILPELREEVYQFNLPVHIGRNVWIGAGAIILPGVNVGDNAVIGAGSVVTRDVPANVVAVGNPCRVLREIGEKDRIYYYKDRKIDL